MRKLHEKVAHLKALSTRNVSFIRRLVIDPITDLKDPAIYASLRCVQLHSLTIYIANYGYPSSLTEIAPIQPFPDYMDSVIAGVSTLTLRFVPNCKYDPEEWSLRRFDRSGEVHVHKADFDILGRFPSVKSLGIITHWFHKIDASRLFLRISAATRHLRIKTLTTNVVPDLYPEFG